MINHSHNTLVIDDQIQNPQARCAVRSFHSSLDRCSAIVDMTDAYKDQVESAWRGIELLDRQAVHVRDEIAGARGNVQWTMVTGAEISLAGNKATLTQDGKTLQAEILMPRDARFRRMSTKPPSKKEKQNRGTQILAVSIAAEPDREVAISVLLQPTEPGKPMVTVQPQRLEEWPSS